MKKFLLLISLFLTSCCGVISTDYTDPIHIVKPGESLADISVHYYGSELQTTIILEANQFKADAKIKRNQKLRIPTLRF